MGLINKEVTITKNKFRYDYNYKMSIITFLVSLLFLVLTVASYDKDITAFYCFGISFLICLFNTFVLIFYQGITVGKKNIIIVDDLYLWITKINLEDLNRVELKEIKKDKKSNLYGFLNEFYHPYTYRCNSKYVYNNGRVFKIIFYLKNNITIDSYFGWMYKEKSIIKVNKIVKKLENFVDSINLKVKENRKNR